MRGGKVVRVDGYWRDDVRFALTAATYDPKVDEIALPDGTRAAKARRPTLVRNPHPFKGQSPWMVQGDPGTWRVAGREVAYDELADALRAVSARSRSPRSMGGAKSFSTPDEAEAAERAKLLKAQPGVRGVSGGRGYRTDASVHRGVAVWGDGLYLSLYPRGAADIDRRKRPVVHEWSVPKNARLLRVTDDALLAAGGGEFRLAGKELQRAVLAAGYDGIRVEGDAGGAAGDQIVLYRKKARKGRRLRRDEWAEA